MPAGQTSSGMPATEPERPAGRAGSGSSRSLTPLVAVIGPPNAGKTTLFNRLTGLRKKVANYPGVTVEKHLGSTTFEDGRSVELVDLPGIRGLSARSLDERVTLDLLRGRISGTRAPDGIVLIVDATRAETDLMLMAPLLEFGLPTLVVFNMLDELESRGGQLDPDAFASAAGVAACGTNARAGTGIGCVLSFISSIKLRGATEATHCWAVDLLLAVACPLSATSWQGGPSSEGSFGNPVTKPQDLLGGPGGWTRYFCTGSWGLWPS